MKNLQNTSMQNYEQEMRKIPNHSTRGGGTYKTKFRYSAEDVDCRNCLHHKHGKCSATECVCIAERLEAGTLPYSEMIAAATKNISDSKFHERIRQLKMINGSDFFTDNQHSVRFTNAFLDCARLDLIPRDFVAALYLLTANRHVWNRHKYHIDSKNFKIGFSKVSLENVSISGYNFFRAACDLLTGTKYLTVFDLASDEIVDFDVFKIIVNSMAIEKFGINALLCNAEIKKENL
jgi:hypothetical protein